MKTLKSKLISVLVLLIAVCGIICSATLTKTEKNKAFAAVGMQTMGIVCHQNDVIQFDVTPDSASDVHLHYCFIKDWGAYRGYADVYLNGSGTNTTGTFVTNNGNGTYTVTTINGMIKNDHGADDTTEMNNCYFTNGSGATTGFTVTNFRVIAENVTDAVPFKNDVSKGLSPVLTDYEGVSFIYKMIDPSKKASVMIGNWSNYYGYFELKGTPTELVPSNGVYLQDLGNGFIKANIIYSEVTRRNGQTDGAGIDVGAVNLIYFNNSTDGNGFVYNLHGVSSFSSVTVNGTLTKVETGSSFTATAGEAPSGKYFAGWSNGSSIVSSDSKYTFTVNGDVALTPIYADLTTRGTLYTSGKAIDTTAIGGTPSNTIRFDYKISSGSSTKIVFLANWSYIEGFKQYINLYSNGEVSNHAQNTGITVTSKKLTDGYCRVTITGSNVSTLTRFYSTAGNNTADVYYDRITFDVPEYFVMVNNGTGTGTYDKGASVTITANAPEQGKIFVGWSDGSTIVSTNSSYTFTVNNNVNLTATYTTARGTFYAKGSGITIDHIAGSPSETLMFDYLITDGTGTKFSLLNSNWGYIGGHGDLEYITYNNDGSFTKNPSFSEVTVSTETLSDGYIRVTITGSVVANSALLYTTAVNHTAGLYVDRVTFVVPQHDITVNNGTGSGTFDQGASVTVTADAPDSGKYFLNWTNTSGTVVSSDASYTFNVSEDVTLTANYGTYRGTLITTGEKWAVENNVEKYYGTVSFEYRAVNMDNKTISLALLQSDWQKYFGYYNFKSNGFVDNGNLAGVTVTPLSDGYYKVTLDASNLARTNNANDRNNVPTTIHGIYSNNSTNTNFYIDNIQFDVNGYTITVVNGTGGGTYDEGTSVTVVANAPTQIGEYFLNWTDGNDAIVSTNASYTFNVTKDVTLTANYGQATTYTLTVNGGSGSGTYVENGEVTAVAGAPVSGKYFLNWTNGSGTVVSSDASYSFNITSNVTLTANYTDYRGTQFTTSSPTSINTDKALMYDTIKFEYILFDSTKSVSICFLDNKGSKYYGYYEFTGSGTLNNNNPNNAIVITPLEDKYYSVSVTISGLVRTGNANTLDNKPDNIGQVYIKNGATSGGYIDNVEFIKYYTVTVVNGTGSGTYEMGEEITVTANSAPSGQVFAGWSNGSSIVSTDNSYTFVVDGDVTLTAIYGTLIHVDIAGADGTGDYISGSPVTVTAEPETGYYFVNWTNLSGEVISTDLSYTFEPTSDVSLRANYLRYVGTEFNQDAVTTIYAPKKNTMYETISFDYILTDPNGQVALCFMDSVGSKYFGYYYFNGNTTFIERDPNSAITITQLDNKYYHVSVNVADLAWSGNEGNLNNAPSDIYQIYIRKNLAPYSGYIDNVYFKKTEYKMEAGASIRLSKAPHGLKFKANIPESIYDKDAKYGMIIIPYDYMLTYDMLKADTDYITRLNYNEVQFIDLTCIPMLKADGDYMIQGSVTSVKEANIDRDFVGIAYSLKDGVYTYAEIDDNRRSIKNVAISAMCDVPEYENYGEEEKQYLNELAGNKSYSEIGEILSLPQKALINQVVEFKFKRNSSGNIQFALINNSDWNTGYYGYFTINDTNISYDSGVQIKPAGTSWEYDGATDSIVSAVDYWYQVTIDIARLSKVAGNVANYTHFDLLYIPANRQACSFEIMDVKVRDKTADDEAYYIKQNNTSTVYDYTFNAINTTNIEEFYYYIKPVSFKGAGNGNKEMQIWVKPFGEYVKLNVETLKANVNYVSMEEINEGYYNGWIKVSYDLTKKPISSNIVGFYSRYTRGEYLIGGFTVEYKPADGEFKVNGFDSNVTYLKTDAIPDSPALKLSSAKNEEELGQLIITALKPSVKTKAYTITLNDLTHEDGETKLSKNNFTVYNGHYVNIYEDWAVSDEQPNKWYPNGYTNLRNGYFVDALVPFVSAQGNNENVIDITNGNNHTLFVNFSIPEGQKAGVYTGTFRILVEDNGYIDFPVEYTVYDFVLSSKNNARNAFEISLDHMESMFGDAAASYSSEEYKELYDFLLDFNITAGRIPDTLYYGDYDWDDHVAMLKDYTLDDRVSAINLYVTYTHVNYSYTYEYKKYSWSSPTDKTVDFTNLIVVNEYDRIVEYPDGQGVLHQDKNYGLRTILQKLTEYSKKNNVNLFEKLFIRLPQNDEPNSDAAYTEAILSYNAVRRSVDYVLANNDWTGYEDLRTSLDNLAYIVTCEPNSSVYAGNKLVDNVKSQTAYYVADSLNSQQTITITYKYLHDYIPMFNYFIKNSDSTTYNNLNTMLTDSESSHTHIWWYGCCQPVNPYPNYDVNSNQVINRSMRWAQFGMGVEGEIYYGVNWWRQNIYDKNAGEFTVEGDLANLDEAGVWQGLSGTAGAMGDGVLVYPNITRYVGADFKYCATFRLYNIRESIDDYNYLCYAQQLIDNLADGNTKTTAQTKFNDIVSSMYNSAYDINGDANILRIARNNLANLIEGLLG